MSSKLIVDQVVENTSVGLVRLDKGQLIATKDNKHGTVLAVVSQKQYGAEHGLKGQALKRAHAEYRREFGLKMNSSISGAIAGGLLVSQKVTPTASGFNVSFIRPELLEVKASDRVNTAVKSAVEEAQNKMLAAYAAKHGCTVDEAAAILG